MALRDTKSTDIYSSHTSSSSQKKIVWDDDDDNDNDIDQSTPESRVLSTQCIYSDYQDESDDDITVEDEKPIVENTYTRGVVNLADTLGWCGCTVLVFILFNTLLLMGKLSWLPTPDHLFAVYISIFLGVFTIVTVTAGILHVYCHANISYTRKVAHFFSFFLPFGLYVLIPFEKTITTYILTFCCSFLSFVPLAEPIRNIPFMWPTRMAFASFDRKEDRPYTLVWAISQALAVYAVMIVVVIILYRLDAPDLAIIPLMITGFGDGLAEVVGRPYGKHKYRTTALFTTKMYTRSVEGSAMIVLTSIIVVTVLYVIGVLSLVQYLVSLVVFPLPMTITEAVSMHSWDNAFLCLVGGILSIGIALIEFL
jgi:phytol kinase